jgi:hypothetical protein
MPLVRVPAELPDRVAVTALRRLLPHRVIGRIRALPSAGGRSRDWGAEAAEWLVPRIAPHPPRTALGFLCCSGDRDHLTGRTAASRASGGSPGTAVPVARVRTGQGRKAHGGAT